MYELYRNINELATDGNENVIMNTRPLLKWAGGKSQLLHEIIPKMPKKFNKYIEPFFGGGALFFALQPENGIIADSNPELINLYKSIANNVDGVIQNLRLYENNKEQFYYVRSQNWETMQPEEAAARTIFLNKTCFNGLYRVNKRGEFNVPFGYYKNPKILDEDLLYAVSSLLKHATIVCDDYLNILKKYAEPNDFIFLDPPYLPISKYADFKRYTKEQFYEEDQVNLSNEIKRLSQLGCNIILTNSNHPLVHELYSDFNIEVISTKRYISCNGSSRKGEDCIVTVPAANRNKLKLVPQKLPEQLMKYPSTRYMGSKTKLLSDIMSVMSQFNFETAMDLFSGSGVVAYLIKSMGKTIVSNDYMVMSYTFAKAMIENNEITLSKDEAVSLLVSNDNEDNFVQNTFSGLYFSDEDNRLIDTLRVNIHNIKNPYKKAIAMSALIRACMKKRPRGIFTYVGERYNDGRKDLQKTFTEQFLEAVNSINKAVFNNGRQNKSHNSDALELRVDKPDLVYIDPPYYSPYSDNEYVRRYHFVEGLARDWKGVDIQENTITKKFKSYPTPFSTRNGAAEAFDHLFKKYSNSILIVSYSSNSQPTLDEMVSIMAKHKNHVEVVPIDYKYSFGNQKSKVNDNKNQVQEYLFVGY